MAVYRVNTTVSCQPTAAGLRSRLGRQDGAEAIGVGDRERTRGADADVSGRLTIDLGLAECRVTVGKGGGGANLRENPIRPAGLEHNAAQLLRRIGVWIANQHDLHGGLQRFVAVE